MLRKVVVVNLKLITLIQVIKWDIDNQFNNGEPDLDLYLDQSDTDSSEKAGPDPEPTTSEWSDTLGNITGTIFRFFWECLRF